MGLISLLWLLLYLSFASLVCCEFEGLVQKVLKIFGLKEPGLIELLGSPSKDL
jgi:hypothetical protein